MNFGEMKTKTRQKLNEVSATFWTDDDIADALNEGLAEMADATEYYERQWNIPLLEGRTYYDLSTLLSGDTFLSPRRGYNTNTSQWLEPTDPREMDYHTFRQWELTRGAPQKYMLRGNWWLGVFPKSPSDTGPIRLYGTAIPPAMSDDTDEPGFPREFHQGVVDFAISDCLSQERETAAALEYWKSYKGHEGGLGDYVQGRQKLARIDVMA